MPYAWQEQDCPIEVESGRSPRLNILGFMSRANEIHAYSIEGYVNSDIVIDCFDQFCKTVTRKTVIVMDNASIHKSSAFKAKQAEWANQCDQALWVEEDWRMRCHHETSFIVQRVRIPPGQG